MPGGAAPRALLGVLALIIAIVVAVVPVVEARPKDKNGGKQNETAADTLPADAAGQTEAAPIAEQPLTATDGGRSADEPTLLQLDADGDYLPDALDNCPSVQNPDQADSDGDGHGDACPVYQDSDGDTVPDKQDNCPNIATSDFADRDGDGVGDPCDKSPDGIEPEPVPVPELGGQDGDEEAAPPDPQNGDGLNGEEVEREGSSRSKQRERTDISRPIITTGSDSDGTGGQPAQEEPPAAEPVRDNPRRNEELIAEAAASGELYAPPEPPPVAQRAWDEDAASAPADWDSIVRIDAGATDEAAGAIQNSGDGEPNDGGSRKATNTTNGDRQSPQAASDADVGDSRFARGWMRAKLLLQEELQDKEQTDSNEPGDGGRDAVSAPVPVENGLVITAARKDEDPPRNKDRDAENGGSSSASPRVDEPEPREDQTSSQDNRPKDAGNRNEGAARQDGSRRDGSSRGAAARAPARQRASADARADSADKDKGHDPRSNGPPARSGGVPEGWSDDRYFAGGSALDWSGGLGVAGTDDDGLYLTQRSGSGPGKRGGFDYAIPVEESGLYMVRLYFTEPYWGSPGGPAGGAGRRVFTVTAEGETLIEDLDVFAEAGVLTALVKQVEVDLQDGELNLRFTAREGEPIVAAIEILRQAR